MCALVKPKDIPFETQCLEKRLLFIKNLKECLGKESRVVTATVDLYSELIEDILQDVCVDVHRDVMTHTPVEDPSDEFTISTLTKETTGRGMRKDRGAMMEQNTEGGGQQSKRPRHGEDDDTAGDVETEKEMSGEEEIMKKMLAKAAIHYGSANMLGIQMSGSKGAVDMFGNMIQPVALDQVACPKCDRKISSGRFAPHLEKCMGGGRLAGRTSKLSVSR
jgi:hypothetical protein